MKNKNQEAKYAISACLLGIPCRFNAKAKLNKKALDLYLKGQVIAICPEILAGLPTPRPACEIVGGDGFDVVNGKAKVVDEEGNDFSKEFLDGANIALRQIKALNVNKCYLKSGSPSCGGCNIYDGTFSGSQINGVGVFSAILKLNKYEVTEL